MWWAECSFSLLGIAVIAANSMTYRTYRSRHSKNEPKST